jgi:hypothetical protein
LVIGDASEHIRQPGLRIEVVELCQSRTSAPQGNGGYSTNPASLGSHRLMPGK